MHRSNATGHRRALKIEPLESRLTMDGTASAAAGLPWFDLNKLTYSFAPDGTLLGEHASTLFEDLSSTGSTDQWQGEFAKALDAWLGSLGVTAQETSDSGAPFGAFGKTQGDTRFGDIRIGAIPLVENVMAEAVPHSIISEGSWAGDILLNANAEWFDLQQVFSVALHEFGHVLGLGHSDDPASPMFFHGVHDAPGPTSADLAGLQKMYAGINIETDDDHESHGSADYEWQDEPKFGFDPQTAIPLTATLGSSVRYSTNGILTTNAPTQLFRLIAAGEVEKLENLNVTVSADQFGGLFPSVALFDSSGDPIASRILHYSTGVVVLQARDVDTEKDLFAVVSSADTATMHQVGGFEFLAEFSKVQLSPTQVGAFSLDANQPIAEQPFTVNTSRLVHVLLESKSTKHNSAHSAVWATLVDANNRVIAQLGMNSGQTRSMPLVFLAPGEYRTIMQTGSTNGSAIRAEKLTLFIDEISIDVGPGIVDPTKQPILTCGKLGADPNSCNPIEPVVVNNPIFPNPNTLPPAPVYPSLPPFTSPSWNFWPLNSYRQNPIMPLDVSGDTRISPADALLVINALNSRSTGWEHPYDSNGDGRLSPTDALLVINHLNSRLSGEGEAPLPDKTLTTSSAPLPTLDELRKAWTRPN